MDESDSDSDSDSGSEDDQSLTEEEQLLITAAIEKRDRQLTSLLERKNELPLRTRNKFNALVAELLTKTKEDIHEMICENNIHDDGYRGLDSSRDTEAEVETAIRFFPEVISQSCGDNEDGVEEEYPIQRLCFSNRNNVSFIALLARLAIYFHSFEDHERGGLLIENRYGGNIFNNLLYKFDSRVPGQNDLLLTLLIRLRRMGLFKKDDIRDYDLVSSSFCENDLPERVFQFLVEWDPTSLIRTNRHGSLPLHYAARTSIRVFRIAFGYGIRYYPLKKGISLLFQQDDDDGDTPFQVACPDYMYGRDKVMNVVEETLMLCSSPYSDNNTPPPPLNIAEAFITASIDENVHLDCSYFLLRRQPDMLMKLLSSSTAAAVVASTTQTAITTTTAVDSDNNDDSDDDDNNNDSNNCHKSKLRKRKREELDRMNHNTK